MMNFTPSDWITIGTSLIASWFSMRALFLLICGIMGLEPEHHVGVTAVVTHVDAPIIGDPDDYGGE